MSLIVRSIPLNQWVIGASVIYTAEALFKKYGIKQLDPDASRFILHGLDIGQVLLRNATFIHIYSINYPTERDLFGSLAMLALGKASGFHLLPEVMRVGSKAVALYASIIAFSLAESGLSKFTVGISGVVIGAAFLHDAWTVYKYHRSGTSDFAEYLYKRAH
ncbi:MAG TPA: hypothetical protein VFU89_03950 [Rhabdochlamydiaceae bacterium]|nr:hypothetical protein [Rhabdochlamydiaceae bacterium]